VIVGRDRMYGVAGEFQIAICDRCGSGRTLPTIAEADLGALYPSTYAPHVEVAGGGRIRAFIRRWAQVLQRRSELRRPPISRRPAVPGTMLDVGCGRGDLGGLMVELGWSVTGIEPAEAACRVAEDKGLKMLCGTLGSVSLGNDDFDIVNFQHSLEHVFDPNAELERVLPNLAADGLLMISVPNFDSWQRRLFGSAWYHLDVPRHRFHYTAAGLTALLARHGLEVALVATTCTPFGIVGSVTNVFAGHWIWDTPARSNAAYGVSLLLRPLDLLISHFGGGDALHIVAGRSG
jgi:SAM-dependent methyltransferase